MATKTKIYLALLGLAALTIIWFVFKTVIISAVTTVAIGALVFLAVYAAIRVWLWRNKRSTG